MARPDTTMVVPTSDDEYCSTRPRNSGNRKVPPNRAKPTMKVMITPTRKLRLPKARNSTIGWRYVRERQTKTGPATAATTVSIRIRLSSNQSFLAPSSSTNCIDIRKVAIRARPHQSKPLAKDGSPLSKAP